ncbi:hypothetical protein K438DRAFT_1761811 [Mycena galopus ATCC 62051]|nr:hypothetical protein K438DRAFT_1761811 [Mycena galopus ATCC 62051]
MEKRAALVFLLSTLPSVMSREVTRIVQESIPALTDPDSALNFTSILLGFVVGSLCTNKSSLLSSFWMSFAFCEGFLMRAGGLEAMGRGLVDRVEEDLEALEVDFAAALRAMSLSIDYHKVHKSQLDEAMIPGPILRSILVQFRLQSRNIDSASILENIDSGVDSGSKIDAGIDARIDVRIDVDSQL